MSSGLLDPRTIRALADTAGTSRVVVSCRVLDYQQTSRQLAGWPAETIIAFSPALQDAFIQRWFELLARLNRPLNGRPGELRERLHVCLLYTSPSPRDGLLSRMPSSA